MFAEIRRDRALQWLGALLALCHTLAALHWLYFQKLADILAAQNWPAVCWPFFPQCAQVHTFSATEVQAALWALIAASLIVALLFVLQKTTVACWSLGVLAIVKLSIVMLDFRLRLNQHAMTAWVVLAFLLIPGKRRAVTWLLVAIYFWAGVLKLNPEWLDGRALYGRLPLPDALLGPACVYVVVLELLLVFGLLARHRWLFWATVAQLAVFHAVSVPVVSYFYPLLMALLLAFPVLCRFLPPPESQPSSRGSWALLGVFSALQWTPALFPGDAVLTGEGRLLALHMFDAPLECQAWATAHGRGTSAIQTVPLRVAFLSNRILCDPLVYASAARDICAHNTTQTGALDLHLHTRRAGEAAFHPVIDAPDVCAQPLQYTMLAHNPWILVQAPQRPAQPDVPVLRGR